MVAGLQIPCSCWSLCSHRRNRHGVHLAKQGVFPESTQSAGTASIIPEDDQLIWCMCYVLKLSNDSSSLNKGNRAARRIFNSLLDVWKCRQTRSLVIDILRIISFRLMDRNETETFFIMKNVYLKNPSRPDSFLVKLAKINDVPNNRITSFTTRLFPFFRLHGIFCCNGN